MRLKCQYSGNPQASVDWYRDDEPLGTVTTASCLLWVYIRWIQWREQSVCRNTPKIMFATRARNDAPSYVDIKRWLYVRQSVRLSVCRGLFHACLNYGLHPGVKTKQSDIHIMYSRSRDKSNFPWNFKVRRSQLHVGQGHQTSQS